MSENIWRSGVILVRGIPGAGKTTFVKNFTNLFYKDPNFSGDESICDFSADQYMVNSEGQYQFRPESLKDCHRACFNRFGQELFGEYQGQTSLLDVMMIHNTFTRLWEMSPYVSCCTNLRRRMIVVRCEGNFDNIHGVPPEKVEEMRARMEPFEGEIILSREDLESGRGAEKVYQRLLELCTNEEVGYV